MINRDSPEYQEAKWRVKVGHAFLEKGHDIKGVVHIGANDGYEVEFYLALGIERVICFEPYYIACELFKEKCAKGIREGKVLLYEYALGLKDEIQIMHPGPGSGHGSTFLIPVPEVANNSPFIDTVVTEIPDIKVPIKTWATFRKENPHINLEDYDCIVCDVQGMELDVLKSIGDDLKYFNFLNIECSEPRVFINGASGNDISEYLDSRGFNQDTAMEIHDDVFFTRRNI